jgi:hypothetical protein
MPRPAMPAITPSSVTVCVDREATAGVAAALVIVVVADVPSGAAGAAGALVIDLEAVTGGARGTVADADSRGGADVV